MLPSLIINLFAIFGKGLVWLAYRKDGMAACKTLERDLNPISTLFGIGLLIWIPSAFLVLYAPFSGEFLPFPTVYFVIYLLIYFIWFKTVRNKLDDLIYDAKVYTEKREAAEAELKKSIREKSGDPYVPAEMSAKIPGWQCDCGRRNADYVMTCSCGITKKEMKLRNRKGE